MERSQPVRKTHRHWGLLKAALENGEKIFHPSDSIIRVTHTKNSQLPKVAFLFFLNNPSLA